MIHEPLGYWVHEAGSPSPEPPLQGEETCDVLIVGGGFTGMWTAWHLSQSDPELRISILESGLVGHGPSGRNGGFANAMWFSFGSLVGRYGQEPALSMARAAEQSVLQIGEFCDEQEIDAWYRLGGYLNVSTAPAQDGIWEPNLDAMRAAGVAELPEVLDPAGVEAICDSPSFRGGIKFRIGANLQPARLAFGIRAALLKRGVRLFEQSPARRIDDGPSGIVATTPDGRIRAGRLVLANGPALAGHGSPLRQNVTLASSHMVITEPVPDVIEDLGWTGGESISDCRSLLDYFRTTPDGRIAFGWGGGRIAAGGRRFGSAELDAEVVKGVIRNLKLYFPMLADRRIEYAWGGPIDASATHLPHVVELPSGRAFAAFGYTGNGVGPSQMVGRSLASLVLDRRDEYTSLAFVEPVSALTKVPPEPFRWLGGAVIRDAIGRKEEAEMTGQQPDPVSAAIAKIPALIGFHIGR